MGGSFEAPNHLVVELVQTLLGRGSVCINTAGEKVYPEEVEEAVCIRIEEALKGTDGIEKIQSSASEGNCSVIAMLFDDASEIDMGSAYIAPSSTGSTSASGSWW